LIVEYPDLLILAPTMGGRDGTPTEALLKDFEGMFQNVFLAVGPVSREDMQSIAAQRHYGFTRLSRASVLAALDAAEAHHGRLRELWETSYVQQSL